MKLSERSLRRIKDKDTARIVRALNRYGLEMRNNGAHIIVKCPLGSSTLSTKNFHMDKQLSELERLGIDIVKLKGLIR
jgi:collagenase-like PrtC family protease